MARNDKKISDFPFLSILEEFPGLTSRPGQSRILKKKGFN